MGHTRLVASKSPTAEHQRSTVQLKRGWLEVGLWAEHTAPSCVGMQ